MIILSIALQAILNALVTGCDGRNMPTIDAKFPQKSSPLSSGTRICFPC